MQHLEVSGAVRPLKWSLGVKGLKDSNRALVVRLRPKIIFELVSLFIHLYQSEPQKRSPPTKCEGKHTVIVHGAPHGRKFTL